MLRRGSSTSGCARSPPPRRGDRSAPRGSRSGFSVLHAPCFGRAPERKYSDTRPAGAPLPGLEKARRGEHFSLAFVVEPVPGLRSGLLVWGRKIPLEERSRWL